MNLLKSFLKDEDGLGTVEIVLILAVLVSIAIIFRKSVMAFVKTTIGNIFNNGDAKDAQTLDTTP
jgi:Flp pilus assembly pilin Flp